MTRPTVHSEALATFKAQNFSQMAQLSGGQLLDSSTLALNYLSHNCIVTSNGDISVNNSQVTLSKNERTLLLQYLSSTPGLPPRGKWLSFLELPEGEHHYVPLQIEGMEPLAQTFGSDLLAFKSRAEALGGQPLEFGDCSYSLPVLPKVPLAVIIYEGDEEFPPKANILFDSSAEYHLTTAQLWVLAIEVAQRLTKDDRIGYL